MTTRELRPVADFELPIVAPVYDPRGSNLIPAVAIDEYPYYCAKINKQWFGHILGVLARLDQPDAWQGTASEIEDARNEIRRFIVSWRECMIVIGSVVAYAGQNSALPTWCLPCDGSQYLRDDYPLLYDVLEPVFRVDSNNFVVPDTRSRFVLSAGTGTSLSNRVVGDTGGAEEHQLSGSEMPSHSHTYQQFTIGIDVEGPGIPDPTGVGYPTLPTQTSSSGGGNAHENMPPFLVLRHYIVARYP